MEGTRYVIAFISFEAQRYAMVEKLAKQKQEIAHRKSLEELHYTESEISNVVSLRLTGRHIREGRVLNSKYDDDHAHAAQFLLRAEGFSGGQTVLDVGLIPGVTYSK